MSFWLSLILAGIGTGCIYSLAGMGVVLTYKATGIFNFAHGAIAMIVAYVLWQLNSEWHVSLAIAAPLTVLVAGPGIGLLLERIVFRYTHLGTEIRAVVDRRELSELAAINANRVAALSWAMGAGLAGLTGVLLAPDGLDPVRLTLLVIETFSIAVVARLVSIPMAV